MQNTYQHTTRSRLSYILWNLMSGSRAAQWSLNWIFLRRPAGSQVEKFINKAAWMTHCVQRTICWKPVMKTAQNILNIMKENKSKIATPTVHIVPYRHLKWTDGWQRRFCTWCSYVFSHDKSFCECFTNASIDPGIWVTVLWHIIRIFHLFLRVYCMMLNDVIGHFIAGDSLVDI